MPMAESADGVTVRNLSPDSMRLKFEKVRLSMASFRVSLSDRLSDFASVSHFLSFFHYYLKRDGRKCLEPDAACLPASLRCRVPPEMSDRTPCGNHTHTFERYRSSWCYHFSDRPQQEIFFAFTDTFFFRLNCESKSAYSRIVKFILPVIYCIITPAKSKYQWCKTIEKQNYSLHTCSASDDYLHFVSKDQKDKQSYVTIISGNGNSTVLNGILSFVQGISTIIGSMLLLFPVSGWWIIPMVLLLTVTCLVVENHNKRKFRELFGNTIRDNRKMSYYSGLLTGSAASYELTLFRLSKPFHERMESLNKEIVGQKKKTAWRASINTMAFRVAYPQYILDSFF